MSWYTPVLFGLNVLSTLCFVLIPLSSVLLLFFVRRRSLWMAPIISAVAMLAVCVIAVGPSLLSVGEYRGIFLWFLLPVQIAVTAALTGIAYIAAHILRKKRDKGGR